MTLWCSPTRTLIASHLRTSGRQPAPGVRPWRWQQIASRRYTTALYEGLRDDPASPPAIPPLSERSLNNHVTYSARGGKRPGKEGAGLESTVEGEAPKKPKRLRRQAAKSKSSPQRPTEDAGGSAAGNGIPSWTRDRNSPDTSRGGTGVNAGSATRWRQLRLGKDKFLQRLRYKARMRAALQRRRARSRVLKPKWISLASEARPSAVVSSVWNRQFAIVSSRYDDQLPLERKDHLTPTLDPAVYEWVDLTLRHMDTSGAAFELDYIPNQSLRGHRWMWMQIALWFLCYEPDRMVDFLRATHTTPSLPINWVEDSLFQLGRHLTFSEATTESVRSQRLLDVFHLLAHRASNERLRSVNLFLRMLMPYCDNAGIFEIWQTIKERKVEVLGFTLLHFATRFAQADHFEQAADALLLAKDHGVMVNRVNFRSTASTVLRSCMTQPDGLRVGLSLVSDLVDSGLTLSGPLCDIIMLNAVDVGDVNTAFAVYRSLVERGLKPRESTFAILLKGCKLNIDDADMLNGVIRDAISNINVRKSYLVATEILHCLVLHHTKHSPETALNTITEAYAQLFDREPLRLLGLPLPRVQQQRATNETVMVPTPHVLGFMISASIQRIQSYSRRPDDIVAIYSRWRELVEGGHSQMAELATTDHIPNMFLMAFIRTPSGLIHASRVVRDMQRPLPPSSNVVQCKPTVQTWSIFLHGFTRHGKTQLADQVLTYMRSKGVEPNTVTWNTLIMGYARTQDVEGTFDALRRAEESGMVWDRWTEGGLKWLRNQSRVQREMEVRGLRTGAQGVDFTERLKEGLEQKLTALAEEERVDQVDVGQQQEERESYRYVPQQHPPLAEGHGPDNSASELDEQQRL